jgi:large subunit ribosomal protein L22
MKKNIRGRERLKNITDEELREHLLKRNKTEGKVYALSQHIFMSAHKVRRAIDQIRGRSYEETLMLLELMPYRACYPILKLVYSAAANARHNLGFNEENLVISKAEVNESHTLKRLKPRARGRSYAIKRPTCHIRIVLKDTTFDKINRYELLLCLKKAEWVKNNKNKYKAKTCHDIYNSGGLWDKK